MKNERRYCIQTFFNVCICRTNIEDVKQLTELSREYDIGIDFHIVESPLIDSPHFKHLDENSTFIRPEDYPIVDDLIDWIAEKHRQGYKIVNQRDRILQMKQFMRGKIEPWGCRAGQNTMIIRTDGTLAPCFPMYSATYDWGVAGKPKFNNAQLADMKKTCETKCFSTLNHIVSYVYNNGRVIKWMINQYLKNGWTEATGTVE
jgi:MoaA/NifB/PqqE/SkfB family radical SAM enzyme